ncbi:MAG: flagellar assembly protein FliW [Spirochaetia bacterium]|nr:flagellar assembly protein FliW [Spirochaetia bacterium]
MKIATKRFGNIEVEEDKILHFPEGIFAFEEYQRYVLISVKEKSEFYWLQSLENSDLAFLVVNTAIHLPDYRPEIEEEFLSVLGIEDITQTECWIIITVPQGKPNEMTANLQGPLLINPKNRKAAQFVSANEKHIVRAPFLEILQKGIGS